MKGLGSQLCDHLVKKVIHHLETEINPRFEQFERLIQKYCKDIPYCTTCDMPYERNSDKARKCHIKSHRFYCTISCGEVWCKPHICNICKNETCQTFCDIVGCNNYACANCSNFDVCSNVYCDDHHKERALKFVNYANFKECFAKETICTDCAQSTAICSNCNEKCKMTDIADVIDIKDCNIDGHTQCGRAICKNCIDNKRIKL